MAGLLAFCSPYPVRFAIEGKSYALLLLMVAPPLPSEFWLASSRPPPAMERKLKPLQSQVVQSGYHCEQHANDLSHARLLRCRSETMDLPE